MKFGRYTAHRRTQHASGARQQDPSPTCPTLLFGASSFGSGWPRGTLQLGAGLPRSIGRLPLGVGTLTEENFVHVREPSGISVRILVEGSPGAHRRTAREGRTRRPCGRVDVWERAARANYGKTHVTWCCRGAPGRDAIKLVQIGQNQAAATHRNRYFYDLRSSPQLHVQFPGTSAAIKARNPRHPQKQLQHH